MRMTNRPTWRNRTLFIGSANCFNRFYEFLILEFCLRDLKFANKSSRKNSFNNIFKWKLEYHSSLIFHTGLLSWGFCFQHIYFSSLLQILQILLIFNFCLFLSLPLQIIDNNQPSNITVKKYRKIPFQIIIGSRRNSGISFFYYSK